MIDQYPIDPVDEQMSRMASECAYLRARIAKAARECASLRQQIEALSATLAGQVEAQVPESCPMHPNWHGQLLTLCADGRYRWRWTCCGRDV